MPTLPSGTRSTRGQHGWLWGVAMRRWKALKLAERAYKVHRNRCWAPEGAGGRLQGWENGVKGACQEGIKKRRLAHA